MGNSINAGAEGVGFFRGITGIAADCACKARRALFCMALALALAAAAGIAGAAPIVDISENDNLPAYNYSGDLTRATWFIIVKNNSDIEPPGNPYDEDITQVQLYNLYSFKQPALNNLPSHWTGLATQGTATGFWDITISCNNPLDYIGSGMDKLFSVDTFRPSTSVAIIVGDRYGQGQLQGWGLQPASPGDVFQSPTGVTPEPATLALVALGGALLRFRRR
jgi:hypothetical protein